MRDPAQRKRIDMQRFDGNAVLVTGAAAGIGRATRVVLLTRALAVEFALRGLRVNCVCPGGVDTALTRGVRFPADAEPRLLGWMMLATQLAKPEDVAAAIAYLASDEARSGA
jgi:NAD(P)-dependent dehydrogenase (short-subunit alcohol dehydrogenase family)